MADFFELAELMCRDALDREESCGGHFRVEHQTEEGEAVRDDENFAHVSAWEWNGPDQERPESTKEELEFEYVEAGDKELQVMDLTLRVWRQPGPTALAASRRTRPRASPRRLRSSRCSTIVNERLELAARSRSCSITIAGRASAAPAD